ncbi:MAG: GNAT family N-acetyltransferase [Chloroflexota bacterium]
MLKPGYDLQFYPTATPFLRKMRPLLETSEARHGLMLGLALRVEQQPHYYGDGDPYFAIVEKSGEQKAGGIVAAALMTPPYGVVLYYESEDETAALEAIAHNLYADGHALPTVQGPVASSAYFAKFWCQLTGKISTIDSETRAFELREVIHPTYSPGHLRLATEDDYDLAFQWLHEFGVEAMSMEGQSEKEARRAAVQRLRDGMLFFWENEEPVSMAGLTRPTARGISIGPVYTPPDQRGHGYASSAVARLSQDMLDTGKEFCALFTDLANPTSNSIYQKIGYRPVGDFNVYRFGNK